MQGPVYTHNHEHVYIHNIYSTIILKKANSRDFTCDMLKCNTQNTIIVRKHISGFRCRP